MRRQVPQVVARHLACRTSAGRYVSHISCRITPAVRRARATCLVCGVEAAPSALISRQARRTTGGGTTLAFHYDPTTWGTIGQWAAAAGTTLVFLTTLYVIRRDAKVRRRSQSRKVVYYETESKREQDQIEGNHRYWYNATVKNLSDEPIYDIRLIIVSKEGRRRLIDGLSSAELLLPEESFSFRSGRPFAFRFVDAFFRDNSGFYWRRRIDGKLEEHGRLSRWVYKHQHLSTPRNLLRWLRTNRQNRRIRKERRQRPRAKGEA